MRRLFRRMNGKNKVRTITDGAVVVAIYAIFLFASRMIGGLIEEWLYFLLPIPLSVFGYKYGIRESLIVMISTLALSFLLINPLTALFYVLPTLGLGMFYPPVMKKNPGLNIEVLFASVISLSVSLLTMVFFARLFDYDIVEDTVSLVDSFADFIEGIGISGFSRIFFRALMVSLIPSVLIVNAILEGIFIVLLTHLLLMRLKLGGSFKISYLLSMEQMPRIVGVIYLFVFGAMCASIGFIARAEGGVFYLLSCSINIGIVFSLLMIYQGMYLIGKWSKVHRKRWVYFLALLSVFIFPPIVIFFGVYQNLSHAAAGII